MKPDNKAYWGPELPADWGITNQQKNLQWILSPWQRKSGWHDEYLSSGGDRRFSYNPANYTDVSVNFANSRYVNTIRYDSLDSKFPAYVLAAKWMAGGWGMGSMHRYTSGSGENRPYYCDFPMGGSAQTQWVAHANPLSLTMNGVAYDALQMKYYEGQPGFASSNTKKVLREDWYFVKNVGLVMIDQKNFGLEADGPYRDIHGCMADNDCLMNERMQQPHTRTIRYGYF